jgi:hypothetical protein
MGKEIAAVKADIGDLKVAMGKEIAAVKADIGDLKVAMGKELGDLKVAMGKGLGDLKVVNVAIFFVLVLLLVLNGGVKIGDAVRLANPL